MVLGLVLQCALASADDSNTPIFEYQKSAGFVEYADLPKPLRDAFMAAEHVVGNYRRRRSMAANLAENWYLRREGTLAERWWAIQRVQSQYSAEEIVAIYMNEIYLGERAYGVVDAARVYFNKSLAELSLAESALLAGLPKAPSRYSPKRYPRRAKPRRDYVLMRMLQLEYITQKEFDAASQEPIVAVQ